MSVSVTAEAISEGQATREAAAEDAPAWLAWALDQAPERTFFEHQGAQLELLVWGPAGAPGILLLHGFRAHAHWWSHIAPFLAGEFRVAALSWSGMGGSEWREDYSLTLYVDEAMAAASAAGLFDAEVAPIVIAHSLGGHVAALMAADAGERFGGMVLVDATVGPRPPNPPPDPPRRTYPTAAEAAARFRFSPAQPSDPHVTRWIAEHAVAETTKADGSTGWSWCFDPHISSKLERPHAWMRLPLAKCRLAFVRGEDSLLVTERLEARQREQAPPGSSFVAIPRAGHHVLADQPLSLVTALRTILAFWRQ
ncbi:MAG TPA: alpha/beta hydrolase [Caulobacteraceae bacterium]|nr:alpha/beta hydrolase [Caulobacteraceae bacterium]